MPISVYGKQRKRINELKALTLYRQGLSTRDVSKALKQMNIKMSNATVWRIVKKLDK